MGSPAVSFNSSIVDHSSFDGGHEDKFSWSSWIQMETLSHRTSEWLSPTISLFINKHSTLSNCCSDCHDHSFGYSPSLGPDASGTFRTVQSINNVPLGYWNSFSDKTFTDFFLPSI